MKPLFGRQLSVLALRRAALVVDIGRQRAAMRAGTAALREQLAWARLAVLAGQAFGGRGWSRALTLGALAAAILRRFRASRAD
jgi:hypothetical protein